MILRRSRIIWRSFISSTESSVSSSFKILAKYCASSGLKKARFLTSGISVGNLETTDLCDGSGHEFLQWGDHRSIFGRRCDDRVTRRGKDSVEFFVSQVAIMLVLLHEPGSIHHDRCHRNIGHSTGRDRCFIPSRTLRSLANTGVRRCSIPARSDVSSEQKPRGLPSTTRLSPACWDQHFRRLVLRHPNDVCTLS